LRSINYNIIHVCKSLLKLLIYIDCLFKKLEQS